MNHLYLFVHSELIFKWKVFFDELNIDCTVYTPKVTLSTGIELDPTFIIPKHELWVLAVPDQSGFDGIYMHALNLCVETKKPVVLLTGPPSFKSNKVMIPHSTINGVIDLCDFDFIPDNNTETGFLQDHDLNGENDYKGFGKDGEQLIQAIKTAKKGIS